MIWLQENWIIAVVGVVVAVVLLWWLLRRKAPEDIAPPAAEPAKPAKPLAPVKPEIIAAEPARFKPIEPAPQPAARPVPVSPPAPPPAPDAIAPESVAPPPPPEPPVSEPPVSKPVTDPQPRLAAELAPEPTPEPDPEPTPIAPEAPPVVARSAPAPATKTDNLQLLKGVGPKMVALLNGLGVTGFQQIADWTDAYIAAIDPQLGAFQGRIARDNIVDQAGYLARGDKAGFEAKYGALGGEL
ncbi:hypothetical protein [Sphingopyxis panaciterrae]